MSEWRIFKIACIVMLLMAGVFEKSRWEFIAVAAVLALLEIADQLQVL